MMPYTKKSKMTMTMTGPQLIPSSIQTATKETIQDESTFPKRKNLLGFVRTAFVGCISSSSSSKSKIQELYPSVRTALSGSTSSEASCSSGHINQDSHSSSSTEERYHKEDDNANTLVPLNARQPQMHGDGDTECGRKSMEATTIPNKTIVDDDDDDDDGTTLPVTKEKEISKQIVEEALMNISATGTMTSKKHKKKQGQKNLTLDAFALVLSFPDDSNNRIGLDKLYHAVKISKTNLKYKEARAIVLGGESWDSSEERLREALLYFLCNDDCLGGDDDTSTVCWSVASPCSHREDGHGDDANNTTWLEHHLIALKILARALDSLLWMTHHHASDETTHPPPSIEVNFKDTFWPYVLDTLLYNIERLNTKNTHITGYSLKVFRLLHLIDPPKMKQMLRHTLLPYVSHLKESCRSHQRGDRFSMIAYETTRLLIMADVDQQESTIAEF